jgi:hypothetical protein
LASREFVVVIPESHANISATVTYRPFDSAEDIKAQAVDSATPDLASIKYHTSAKQSVLFWGLLCLLKVKKGKQVRKARKTACLFYAQ